MEFCSVSSFPLFWHITYLTKWPTKLMDEWQLLQCSAGVDESDVFSIMDNSSNTCLASRE